MNFLNFTSEAILLANYFIVAFILAIFSPSFSLLYFTVINEMKTKQNKINKPIIVFLFFFKKIKTSRILKRIKYV